MEVYKLKDMVNGWFIGNFNPSLFKTNEVEVGIKIYEAGFYEKYHYHKIATEFTVIISGMVQMNEINYSDGDIIKIEPGAVTDFKTLSHVVTVVVKIPGPNDDKYTL